MKQLFVWAVVGAILLDFILIFTPYTWLYFYDKDVLDAFGWNGFNSKLGDGQMLRYLLFAAYGIVSIGLIFFKRWARTGFVLVTILTIGLASFWGVSVQYGYESAIGMVIGLLDGAILAMMNLTNLSNEFERAS